MCNCVIKPQIDSEGTKTYPTELVFSLGESVDFESGVLYEMEAPTEELLFVKVDLDKGSPRCCVAYSKDELRVLKSPTGNHTLWFIIPREDLYEISDLELYLPKTKTYV
jgi:hypothetical protein